MSNGTFGVSVNQVEVKARWTGHTTNKKKLVTGNTSRKYNLK